MAGELYWLTDPVGLGRHRWTSRTWAMNGGGKVKQVDKSSYYAVAERPELVITRAYCCGHPVQAHVERGCCMRRCPCETPSSILEESEES